MIDLDGLILNITIQDILTELRYELHIQGYNYFSVFRDSGNDIMTNCPFHKNGQEHKPSFGINKKNGVCHCFTCGYCANLQELISNIFGKNDFGYFGNEWLKKNFAQVEVDERSDIDLDLARKELPRKQYSFVPEMVLEQYRYIHPYMYKRRLTDEIIERYDVGYDYSTDCITFPVRNIDGDVLFIARRAVETKFFSYPSGIEKSLYGIYELYRDFNVFNEIIVCESIINCLTVVSMGFPCLALNGTGTKQQVEELSKIDCRSFVLALDPDDAGNKGIDRIAKSFGNTRLLYRLPYKDNRDINDLSEEEFKDLYVNKLFV